ncbi:MAG: pilus assembly protein [Tenericutes bacterium]|jgi:Flp pilus assembly protein TadG|nr:pilus assembly protein [Mycoplasmatota bacterium]
MRNRGQILVLFVIILPLVLLIAAYVIDMGLIMYEENRLKAINDSVIDYVQGKQEVTEAEIKALIVKNDNKVVTKIIMEEKHITIMLEKEVNSIFGNVLGIKNYQIKSVRSGNI